MDQLLAQKILWGVLVLSFSYWVYQTVMYIIHIRKKVKDHVVKMKKLDDQKCKGPHSWVKFYLIDEEKHVCKDCCWCPDLEDYVKRSYVDGELRAIEFRKGLEEYTRTTMINICDEFSLSQDNLGLIKSKLDEIKKNYTLEYIEKNLEDYRKVQ